MLRIFAKLVVKLAAKLVVDSKINACKEALRNFEKPMWMGRSMKYS